MHSTTLTAALRATYARETRSFPELDRLARSIMIERAAQDQLRKILPVRRIKTEIKCDVCHLIFAKRFGSCPNC